MTSLGESLKWFFVAQIPFAQFLDKSRLVTQALEIDAKAVYRRIFENPCVGGSIQPRATKNLNSPLVGLFSFGLAEAFTLLQ